MAGKPFIVIYFLIVLLAGIFTYPVERFKFSPADIIDLTYPFNAQTVSFFQQSDFQLTIDEKIGKTGDVVMRQGHFQAHEHVGTHLDSPAHFSRNGSDMADLSTDQLIGPAVVINVTAQVRANPDYGVSVADINQFEATYGRIPAGAFVCMYSEWGQRWPDRQRMYSADNNEPYRSFRGLHFPGFEPAATRFLIMERQIRGIIVDSPSLDPAPEATRQPVSSSWGTHVLIAGHGKIGIEYAAHLDEMPPVGGKSDTCAYEEQGRIGCTGTDFWDSPGSRWLGYLIFIYENSDSAQLKRQ
ncbi:isatin hydrolase-like [Paramacrobiotus metropolitanus]|uniref:isatin hydrolase-like n=1 Tax=Paramacrobiotus metropolitanus TaxID=2943436 RepID=UPI002445A631|nr:isatin hydrolase-like [Paramacrobiotus metropolitanus]